MSAKSALKTIDSLRDALYISLIVGAPFTLIPSYALPFEGLISFRLGLYQVLLGLFVLLMLPVAWQKRRVLLNDRMFFVPILVLVALVIASPFRSLIVSRSLLMSGSILLLLLAVVSGYIYRGTRQTKAITQTIERLVVGVGMLVAAFCIVQFMANTYSDSVLGICGKCTASVFGFPRISGFTAEPQFLASTLLLPILLTYAATLRAKRPRMALFALGVFVFILALTLSRGGVVASIAGLTSLTILLALRRQLDVRRCLQASGVMVIAVVMGVSALVWSARTKNPQTDRITSATFATIAEHMSGGVIQLPYNDPLPAKSEPSAPQQQTEAAATNEAGPPQDIQPAEITPIDSVTVQTPPPFESPGEIRSSQAHREGAVSTGLRFWRQSSQQMLFGLGSGNLGSYAFAQDPTLTLSFTIYMQYVLIIVELGALGLISFAWLLGLAIFRSIRRAGSNAPFEFVLASLLIAYSVHFVFFGTYINTPYVWLLVGASTWETERKVGSKKLKRG